MTEQGQAARIPGIVRFFLLNDTYMTPVSGYFTGGCHCGGGGEELRGEVGHGHPGEGGC